MYENLEKLISEGDFKEALYEFQDEYFHIDEQSGKDAARLCVLEGTIWEALNDGAAELNALSRGLLYDYTNYEIYYMMGLYYKTINVNWAYLCMEMALNYCSVPEDRAVVESSFDEVKKLPGVRVRNTSVMILSYNDPELCRLSIEALEKYVALDSADIVVVDNASTQKETIDYLRKKKSSSKLKFSLIESSENLGFPKGCNLGAKNCDPENDIFFLNNDAVITPLSLFFMRMGLYDNRNVGAVSALSNSASLQEISSDEIKDFIENSLEAHPALYTHEQKESLKRVQEAFLTDNKRPWHKNCLPEDAITVFELFAASKSTFMQNPYIRTFRLTGFAVLISREAVNSVAADGMVFDELYSPGYFEDDDLGIRISLAGFEQYICKNSFVYHNGGDGFSGHNDAMEKGRNKFKGKWEFDVWEYSLPWVSACDEVIRLCNEKKGILKVLDLSCGMGANASYIKNKVSNVYICGICPNVFAAGIAQNIVDEAYFGNPNTIRIPDGNHSFDIVIAERAIACKPQIYRYLKADGEYIGDDRFSL